MSNETHYELCNLLTIKPLHYQLQQEPTTQETALFLKILEHLYKIDYGIELLCRQADDKEIFHGIWLMIYQVYQEFDQEFDRVYETNVLSELGE